MKRNFFYIIDEATNEIISNVGYDLDEAISDAKKLQGDSPASGRYLVVNQDDKVFFDTNPNVSFKF